MQNIVLFYLKLHDQLFHEKKICDSYGEETSKFCWINFVIFL